MAREEFTEERRKSIRRIGSLEGAEEWSEEFEVGDDEEKVALLLGKRVEGVERDIMNIIDGCLLKELLGSRGWKRRKDLMG